MTFLRHRSAPLLLATVIVLAAAACGGEDEDEGATMRPGEDCTSCHQSFTLAGTVYAADTLQGAAGVDLTVADDAGVVRYYTSNSAGNFYTTDPMVFPVDIWMTRGAGTVSMPNAVTGGCNACHDASWPLTVP
jgi:hypothetical protein